MEWIVKAMIVMGVLVFGATATGQGEVLCTAIGGKYSPATAQTEICPGGKWSNLLRPAPHK